MPEKPPSMSWESFSEYLVRKSMREGEFDNLPGAGRPIAGLEEPYREDWWLRSVLKRENLAVPCPSLEIRRDVECTLNMVGGLGDEERVRREIESLNARIAKVNRLGSSGPATAVAPLDVDAVVARWRAK
jgi:hypothetical protein